MVLRILPILLLTLLVSDLYIYYRFFWRHKRPMWTYFTFIPNILLSVATLVLCFPESHTVQNMQQMALFFSIYLLFAVPKTLYLTTDLIGRGISRLFPKSEKVCSATSIALSFILFLMILSGLTFGTSHIVTEEATFRSNDLPASFNGYRIVQISDLHLTSFCRRTGTVEDIVEKIMNLRPDMIVFTGDLVSIDVNEMDGFDDILSRLKAPDGVYSVMGNHDYLTYAHYLSPREQTTHRRQLIERQKAMGWDMLMNEHRIIRRGPDSIAIVGVENDGKPPFPARGDLKKA